MDRSTPDRNGKRCPAWQGQVPGGGVVNLSCAAARPLALIGERQRKGIALAKARGIYRGRSKALSLEKAKELRKRVAAGQQKAGKAREYGISFETLYQDLRTKS